MSCLCDGAARVEAAVDLAPGLALAYSGSAKTEHNYFLCSATSGGIPFVVTHSTSPAVLPATHRRSPALPRRHGRFFRIVPTVWAERGTKVERSGGRGDPAESSAPSCNIPFTSQFGLQVKWVVTTRAKTGSDRIGLSFTHTQKKTPPRGTEIRRYPRRLGPKFSRRQPPLSPAISGGQPPVIRESGGSNGLGFATRTTRH